LALLCPTPFFILKREREKRRLPAAVGFGNTGQIRELYHPQK